MGQTKPRFSVGQRVHDKGGSDYTITGVIQVDPDEWIYLGCERSEILLGEDELRDGWEEDSYDVWDILLGGRGQ